MGKEKQTPLTLEGLVDYNEKVFLPALEHHFATKEELQEFRNEFSEFKDETRANFDAVIGKLDLLLTEKDTQHYKLQKNDQKWQLVSRKLQKHRIITPKEADEIAS